MTVPLWIPVLIIALVLVGLWVIATNWIMCKIFSWIDKKEHESIKSALRKKKSRG